jgi:hypothetical protein
VAASLIFFGMLALTFSWQVAQNLDKDLAAMKLPLLKRELLADHWWSDGWQTLPRERTHLKTVAAREFNFQYAGTPESFNRLLAVHGWQRAEPANWRWSILSLNPEASEVTLPPLKRDYLGRADTLLLHRLGGDPLAQETIRLWDCQIANEVLLHRLVVFSFWSALPAPRTSLDKLAEELGGMQTRQANESVFLIRDQSVSPDS